MWRKTFAVIALATLAIFSVPTAAGAVGYVPGCSATVTGSATPGGTVTVAFCSGSFTNSEQVAWGVTGQGTVVLSAFKAATVDFTNSATGTGAASLNITLPANAAGTYTGTATGRTSGTIGMASFTVVVTDAGLAGTGYNAPILLIWAAVVAVLLGIGLMVVLTIVRRKRAKT